MKTVSAREANHRFSKILAVAEDGEEVVITKRGKPVAKLVSMTGPEEDKERAQAHGRLMKRLRKGFELGGKPPSRDEMHER